MAESSSSDSLRRRQLEESIDRKFENLIEMLRQIAESRKRCEGGMDDQSGNKKENRTLLIKIHQLNYSITWDVLDQVFARFGGIEYLEIFSSGDDYHPEIHNYHSKIRFHDRDSAIRAFDSLNHRNIYDGGCLLELFLEEIEIPNPQVIEQIVETSDEQEPSLEPSKSDFFCDLGEKRIDVEMEIPDQLIIEKSEIHQEIVENSKELRIQFESTHMVVEESESATVGLKESKDNSVEDNGESNSEFPNPSLALISDTFESSISASNVSGQVENGMVVERIDLTKDELMIDGLLDPLNEISKMSTDFGIGSVGFLKFTIANQVLVEESRQGRALLSDFGRCFNTIADAHNVFDKMSTGFFSNLARWVQLGLVDHSGFVGSVDTFRILGDNGINLVFDPGGIDLGLLSRNEGEGINVLKAQILWSAHEVFEEMPRKQIVLFAPCFELRRIHDTAKFLEFGALDSNMGVETVIFKPNSSNRDSILYPYDRGKGVMHHDMHIMCQLELILISHGIASLPDTTADVVVHMVLDRKLGFDPRAASLCSELCGTNSLVNHATCFWKVPIEYGFGVAIDKIFVFDPGISEMGTDCYQISPQVHLWSNGYKGLLVIYNQSAAEIELTCPGVSIYFGARSFNITKEDAAACCPLCLSMLVVISGCYIRL